MNRPTTVALVIASASVALAGALYLTSDSARPRSTGSTPAAVSSARPPHRPIPTAGDDEMWAYYDMVRCGIADPSVHSDGAIGSGSSSRTPPLAPPLNCTEPISKGEVDRFLGAHPRVAESVQAEQKWTEANNRYFRALSKDGENGCEPAESFALRLYTHPPHWEAWETTNDEFIPFGTCLARHVVPVDSRCVDVQIPTMVEAGRGVDVSFAINDRPQPDRCPGHLSDVGSPRVYSLWRDGTLAWWIYPIRRSPLVRSDAVIPNPLPQPIPAPGPHHLDLINAFIGFEVAAGHYLLCGAFEPLVPSLGAGDTFCKPLTIINGRETARLMYEGCQRIADTGRCTSGRTKVK